MTSYVRQSPVEFDGRSGFLIPIPTQFSNEVNGKPLGFPSSCFLRRLFLRRLLLRFALARNHLVTLR